MYEWIAAAGRRRRVIDMACGEGYGSAVLASAARSVVGLEANPEAFEHARLRYRAANLRFERGMVETFGEPGGFDAVVFLQTIEHVLDPTAVLRHFAALLAPGGVAYVSTPNVLTLAPPGASKSDNPWHLREYRASEFRAAVRERVRLASSCSACSTPASCALHELALHAGWDADPPGAADHEAVLRPLHAGDRDQRLRAASGPARPRARLPRDLRPRSSANTVHA